MFTLITGAPGTGKSRYLEYLSSISDDSFYFDPDDISTVPDSSVIVLDDTYFDTYPLSDLSFLFPDVNKFSDVYIVLHSTYQLHDDDYDFFDRYINLHKRHEAFSTDVCIYSKVSDVPTNNDLLETFSFEPLSMTLSPL